MSLVDAARAAAVRLSCLGMADAQILSLLERTESKPQEALALARDAPVRPKRAGRGRASPGRGGPRRPHAMSRSVLAPPAEAVDARVERGLKMLDQQGAAVVLWGGEGYPPRLYQLADPPPILYLRGRVDLLDRTVVGIVGARRHTEYGAEAARMMAGGLSAAGVTVASGLALGIDAIAHEASLAGGTVAVLGCGIDVVYPRQHEWLHERIASEGLLISEFAPGEPALPYHFPQRNRILAALADAVLVVEATARSGSLITAEHAIDLNRDVFAVPGPIGRETSEGTNELLRDGAFVATSSHDILEELGLRPRRGRRDRRGAGAASSDEVGAASLPGKTAGVPPVAPANDGATERLWAAVDQEPRHVDAIGAAAGVGSGDALASLLRLELAGAVRQWPGMRFSRGSR